MTLKNGFGKCSSFVLSANVFQPKKTLIWRRHCSIGRSCHMRFYPFEKPITSPYFRSLVVSVLFARFHFKVIRKSLYQLSTRER